MAEYATKLLVLGWIVGYCRSRLPLALLHASTGYGNDCLTNQGPSCIGAEQSVQLGLSEGQDGSIPCSAEILRLEQQSLKGTSGAAFSCRGARQSCRHVESG